MGKKNGFNTQKIFKYLRLGALAMPAVNIALGTATPQEKLRIAMQRYTGFNMLNNTFNMQDLITGWGPFVATTLVTAGVPKLTKLIRGL